MSSVLKIGQTCLTAEETYDLLAPGPCAKPAPRPLSLRSNFSWTFAGNVVYAGCQWGMLMVLAKLGSPERVGQFALGLALTAPVIMLTNLQLRAIQATDARREYRFGHYLALRLATTALSLLVIAGIACGYRLETALVILAVGLSKAFESLSDVVLRPLAGPRTHGPNRLVDDDQGPAVAGGPGLDRLPHREHRLGGPGLGRELGDCS